MHQLCRQHHDQLFEDSELTGIDVALILNNHHDASVGLVKRANSDIEAVYQDEGKFGFGIVSDVAHRKPLPSLDDYDDAPEHVLSGEDEGNDDEDYKSEYDQFFDDDESDDFGSEDEGYDGSNTGDF
jgi:hypothetical protein